MNELIREALQIMESKITDLQNRVKQLEEIIKEKRA